jgi:hypothetical protein
LTEQQYQDNLQYVTANGISSTLSMGTAAQIWYRLNNPTLNDIGVAKIQVGTAMEAVSYYDQHRSEFGASDALDLQKYAGNTPQLVADLIDRTTTGDVSVALQAVLHSRLTVGEQVIFLLGPVILTSKKQQSQPPTRRKAKHN